MYSVTSASESHISLILLLFDRFNMDLGRAIKLCRTQRGLNQSELASLSGISVSYISLLEKNKRDPSVSTLRGIADALEVPFSILVFLAVGREELVGIDKDVADKLASVILSLLSQSNDRSQRRLL